MKKIAFCGDSFFSIDDNRIGTHFSELIAKTNNYLLINNSIPGSSNTYISFQVFDLVQNHKDVDFAVIGFTNSDRFDTNSDNFDEKINFDSIISYYQDKKLFSNTYPYLISKNFSRPELFFDNESMKKFQETAGQYFKRIHHEQISFYQDILILISSLLFLKNQNISFICINHFNQNKKYVDVFSKLAGIEIIDFDLLEYFSKYDDKNSVNHITPIGQKVLANNLVDVINNKLNKNLQKIQ